MRCDVHVHSYYSGFVNQPILRHLGRDSYSPPLEVYEAAKRRGMDLVTLSDHDSIEGAQQLLGRPDFFMSEEVTCVMDGQTGQGERVLHLGVLGISEAQHAAISMRRTDPGRLVSYLEEQEIAWCVNHLFSPLTGPRQMSDFSFALSRARALETRNGMMPEATNEFAAREALRRGMGTIGGSDAHAIPSVARAFTVVGGAQSAAEFLAGVREGRAVAEGRSGSTAVLTRDIALNFARGYVENFREAHRSGAHALRALGLAAFTPVLTILPVLTALIHRKEVHGAARLYADFIDAGLAEVARRSPRYNPTVRPSPAPSMAEPII